MSTQEPSGPQRPDPAEPRSVEQRIEHEQDRAGAAGDGLAQAVDRHRDELGMPPEPADGEDVSERPSTS